MKTPTEYNKMIKEGYITKNVLGEVLFSINKRAKNWRDRKRQYKHSIYQKNYEDAVENEEKYYSMKDDILSHFKPECIHVDIKYRTERVRIYNTAGYDRNDKPRQTKKKKKNFYKLLKSNKYEICHRGSFFDYYEYCEVEFIDIVTKRTEDKKLYFKYYTVGNNTFHTPIEEQAIPKDLEIIELVDFKTEGEDINELLSTQFCKKVHELLMDNKLQIVE